MLLCCDLLNANLDGVDGSLLISEGSLRITSASSQSVCVVSFDPDDGTSLEIPEKADANFARSTYPPGLSSATVLSLLLSRDLCLFAPCLFLTADVSELRLLLQHHWHLRFNSFRIPSARHSACLRRKNAPRISMINWRAKQTSVRFGLRLPCSLFQRMSKAPF